MYLHLDVFGRYLRCQAYDVALELCSDMNLNDVTVHLYCPVLRLVGGIIAGLESFAKSESVTSFHRTIFFLVYNISSTLP